MILQSKELGTINATAGLTIPYSFNYLDTNLSDGPKKYYLKYKLEKDPSSNASVSSEPQGIVNISTLNSIGTSSIRLSGQYTRNSDNQVKVVHDNTAGLSSAIGPIKSIIAV
jgi:hypothetical protein